MTIHFGFAPDAARAEQLDHRMHRELGLSLDELCSRAAGKVPFDDGAMRTLIDALGNQATVSPEVFGRYYDLTIALMTGDLRQAEQGFAGLARMQPIPTPTSAIRGLDAAGTAEWSDIYRRKMTQDASDGVDFAPPSAATLDAFHRRHAEAVAMTEEVAPELAAEVRALVRDIVCVCSAPNAEMTFQGGSHYQLWGALFLNADYHDSPLALVEVIAHESAHSLLFGFCVDEPLVYNDDDARYPSPLRADPRPMDGIYHATFVSARMHWVMRRMLDSGLLQPAERDLAAAALAESRRAFQEGYAVVEQHAQMSRFAAELMDGARTAMSELTA